MKTFILAGGSGTRLWPVSRKGFPKQFMKLNGEKSLLCKTIERAQKITPLENIYIITNENYRFHVKEDLKSISEDLEKNILLEPVGRNTAPAVALALKYCLDKLGCDNKEVVFVTPSDHIIEPVEKFNESVKIAREIVRNDYIVTFGIKPDSPETGYGYVKRGKMLKGLNNRQHKGYEVEGFIEKPDIEKAKEYIGVDEYYWNSGMFAFTIETMMEELEKYAPEIYQKMHGNFDELIMNFETMPDISIDYAVMEKSHKTAVLPMDITWSDVGSWDSLFSILKNDDAGNIKMGNVIDIDTKRTMIIGNKRLIATIGLEDLVIIETDDALLVSRKGNSQMVKDIVTRLRNENKKEAIEHITIYRPWGSYTVLEEGPRYKIKRIVVKPRQKISHQMHHHRSEHWIVVKGTAKVMIGDKEEFVHENESTYVPKSAPHRLENPGKISLELIEVQNGEYVEEDDILRFDDIYGRVENEKSDE